MSVLSTVCTGVHLSCKDVQLANSVKTASSSSNTGRIAVENGVYRQPRFDSFYMNAVGNVAAYQGSSLHASTQGIKGALSTARRLYQALMQYPQQPKLDRLNLLAMSRILPALHNDLVLRRYVCPISQTPIRHAVGDPNGREVYEREEIEH